MSRFRSSCSRVFGIHWLLFFVLPFSYTWAQDAISFDDLKAFENPGSTWKVAGDVLADLTNKGVLEIVEGSGILVNLPTDKDTGRDLFTSETYGDFDLDMEYLVAKGSNSGIYLQGMYEIQILDSWGVRMPRAADNGGIYQRWDETKPTGQRGYQGYAPRQNASKAPGLWQSLSVSFRAPRFDAAGEKTENARILYVQLNGVTLHENVELFGPTRGAMAEKEVSRGPLRIQGDHGAVAFRNLQITSFDHPAPELQDLSYSLYTGKFDEIPDFSAVQAEKTGPLNTLSASMTGDAGQFAIRYRGQLHVHEEGNYSFLFSLPGGNGRLSIDGSEIATSSGPTLSEEVYLEAGMRAFELVYLKVQDWVRPNLAAEVAGPGIRPVVLSDPSLVGASGPDPIRVDPKERPVLRSFMDIPGGYRVTHAVSVGSPQQVNYTYDMDFGHLVQVWSGAFLNATPMWHSRGDGSSRPMGAIVHLGTPALSLARLASLEEAWPADTLGSRFRTKGYLIGPEAHDLQFLYESFDLRVEDSLEPLPDGKGIRRSLRLSGSLENTYLRLAVAGQIVDLGKGLFLVGDKAYYLELNEENSLSPMVRSSEGRKELLVPAKENMGYIMWF
ncbi:DUF1080 domain-containing protein [Cyclobacterium xiamenense]|uniref:3-keto-disaccharide hydrolase n=1 Tax=Cyclobacterium xiamenense TaxID=1297121 RepID=UPI0035D093B9